MGDVGRGRSGKDRNPNYHRTESVLPILSLGDETSGINGEASLHGGFHHLVNLGTNSAPDFVKWGTVNSTDRLGRPIGESTGGLGPGILVRTRAVQEVRVFAVVGNSAVVRSPLVIGNSVGGDNGGIAALQTTVSDVEGL